LSVLRIGKAGILLYIIWFGHHVAKTTPKKGYILY